MASKAHIRRTIRMPDGRKLVKDFYGSTKKEANQRYLDFVKAQEHAEGSRSAAYFAEVADGYLASRSCGPTTMLGYAQKVKELKELFADRLIDTITFDELQAYLNANTHKSVNTLKKLITHMKGIFAYAIEQGIIGKNPAAKVKVPTTAQKPRTPKWYTAEEARALIDHAKGCGKAGLAVIIPLKSGLRPGEVAALNVARDVDFDAKEITVRESIKNSQSGFKVGKPKTQTSARVVPIDDELLECLRPYKDVGYLFANRWGLPMNYNNFIKFIEEVYKDAPVPELHPHDLRHTYGTLLYESGTNLYDIMTVMGHSDMKVTQIYVHQDQKKLAERIKLGF